MPKPNQPPSTVRLSSNAKKRVLNEMDRSAGESPVDRERRRLRVSYRHDALVVHIFNYEKVKSTYSVVPRNLSTQGIGFLHGTFVYPDSKIVVELKSNEGKTVRVTGCVRTCRLVAGSVHEVGVVFNLPIDLSQFVTLEGDNLQRAHCEFDNDSKSATEGKSLEINLTGKALIVEDSAAEQKLLTLWLSRLGLEVIIAPTVADAKEKMEGGTFVFAMVGGQIGDDPGTTIIKELAALENPPPVLAMSADEDAPIAQGLLDAGAVAFLSKPLNEDETVRAVAQIMGVATGDPTTGDAIQSSLCGDREMAPLIEEFVASMAEQIADLKKQLAEENTDALAKRCHQLKGAGGSYGFEILTETAKSVVEHIHQNTADLEALHAEVDKLIDVAGRLVA